MNRKNKFPAVRQHLLWFKYKVSYGKNFQKCKVKLSLKSHIHLRTKEQYNRITSFHSTSLVITLMRLKKKDANLGHYLSGDDTFSPHLHGISLGTPISFYIQKMCTWGEVVCLNCPRQSKVWVHPVLEGHPVQGGFPPAALSCQGEAPAIQDPTLA